MKAIVPHLWFDKEAVEAAQFYTSLFEDSRITGSYVMEDTPSGDSTAVNFELAGQPFAAVSAGPYFTFNPSLSIMVQCNSEEEVDKLWRALLYGGKVLMPLDSYPFSERYGWLEDRYGLSWQISLVEDPLPQKLLPHFMFSDGVNGRAEEAVKFYTELFPDSSIDALEHYQPGDIENQKAKIMFSTFHLGDMHFNAMDDAYESDFTFNEAFSLEIFCENQEELDHYWHKLSAHPESEQCGWVKDKFGVSWQIVPEGLDELLSTGSKNQIYRVTQKLLQMKKIDMRELEKTKNQAD